jgi:hypothetical protein
MRRAPNSGGGTDARSQRTVAELPGVCARCEVSAKGCECVNEERGGRASARQLEKRPGWGWAWPRRASWVRSPRRRAGRAWAVWRRRVRQTGPTDQRGRTRERAAGLASGTHGTA